MDPNQKRVRYLLLQNQYYFHFKLYLARSNR